VDINRVNVRRTGDGWGVTQPGLGWFLAEFPVWDDAFDYARSVALTFHEAIVESEDRDGRVTVRQVLATDARGVVSVRSLPLAEVASVVQAV
jgi:hypothetical protein